MDTFFYGSEEKEEITGLYLQKLDEFLIRYELMRIETTYGDTQVVITGEKKNPALVLLYGLVSGASFAGDTTFNLVNDFRIYAVDVSVHPNLSDEGCLSMNDDSYGKWMYEIMSRLGVRNVFLTGISLGGFVALKTLVFDERKISKAFLINPLGIVHGNEFYNFLVIPLISKKEVERIKTPLHIFADENEKIFPGGKLLKRAKQLFPNFSEGFLLSNSKDVVSEKNKVFIIRHIILANNQ